MKFDLSRHGSLVVARLEGAPEPGDFERLLDGLEAHPDWRPGKPMLVDKTGYDTSRMTVGDVYDIAEVCTRRSAVVGASRVAILVQRDLEYGMNRMFLAFVQWEADADVFRDRARAEAWVAGRAAEDRPG